MPDRQLLLLRHAKSDWGDRSLSDHDRPLNLRGLHDAPRMAQWMEANDAVPDRILCSTAIRARETVDLMIEQWSSSAKLDHFSELYLAAPQTIAKVIAHHSADASRVMVVAHNPGISATVDCLTGQPSEMPTAALAIINAACPTWDTLDLDGGSTLVGFMRPKALPGPFGEAP